MLIFVCEISVLSRRKRELYVLVFRTNFAPCGVVKKTGFGAHASLWRGSEVQGSDGSSFPLASLRLEEESQGVAKMEPSTADWWWRVGQVSGATFLLLFVLSVIKASIRPEKFPPGKLILSDTAALHLSR